MRGSQKLLDLLEDIYDAALEPARWSDVVVSINGFVGGQACGLISKDAISKFGVTHYYCGADPHFIQLYSETHSKFDPLAVLPRLGKVVGIPDLVRYDDYRMGRFYQEWLRPQGAIDVANVVLDNSKPNCPILLTFLSGKRMVDDDMRRRISLIAPHARRALLINQAIDRRQSERATFADALDGLNAGIFLIDASYRIVHANAAGHDILGADDFLRSIGGRLVIRDTQANKRLRDIFATDGTSTSAATGMALPLTAHDGERYVARVLPLASLVRRRGGMEKKAVAALFVRKVELDSQSCGQLLARTFELTPTELRVLLSIVEIGGVPETAEMLGVAESTVKTHLHRIYAKTGASRQADLVKLAAGYSSPLAH
jgi:DNA-binding CsgD family transcriptional regulator/PAS domain-containing protein